MNTPKIIKEVFNFLKSKGHKCMVYNIAREKLEWCCKDECSEIKILDDMARRNKEAYEFANSLKEKGHNCIEYLESYPIQIKWCNNEICIK